LEMEGRLLEMTVALEAVLVANWAVAILLHHLEIRPDAVAGHSTGEFGALVASGILADEAIVLKHLAILCATSERLTAEGRVPEGALAAVGAGRKRLTPLIEQFGGQLYIANDNCPHQVVIAGEEEAVEKAIEHLRAEGVMCQRLPFNRAYHTPMFREVTMAQREYLLELPLSQPEIEIYSCSTMAPYPRDLEKIREMVIELWSRPVEFTGSIEAMYDAGVRIFVEAGPKGNLTAFVEDILRGRPHLAIPCDVPHRSGVTQLNHLVGALAAHGVSMRLDYLYRRRSPSRLSLDEPTPAHDRAAKHSPSQKLSLDLPTMRLSPERARSLVPRFPVSVASAMPMSAGHEGQRSTASAPVFGSLSSLAEPREQLAFGSSGLNTAVGVHPSPDVAEQVMHEHLQTMERFLVVGHEVMGAFLGGSRDDSALGLADTPPVATIGAPSFPFIGTVTSLKPGREVVSLLRIDPDEHVFLRDHSYTGRISDFDEALKSLPTVAFTMCMEIVAEAAAMLMPGKILTGMRQIEVRQWVDVGTPITLEITARKRTSEEEVEVQIRNLGDAARTDVPTTTPTVQATAIFGETYPQAPTIAPLSVRSERPCRHTAAQMYEERVMFHGPRFQGVSSLDRWGENGILGHLQVLPPTDLFRSTPAPDLLTDPILLDAAGQLLGYWAFHHLETGRIVFPFRVSALEIYGSTPPVSQRVRCDVEVEQVSPLQVRATMNLFGPDGRLLLRLVGWEDWRFFWPKGLFDFLYFPRGHPLSEPWETPISRLPGREAFVCQWLNPSAEHTRAVTVRSVAHIILSRTEREQWRDLRGPDIRRSEWLFGRAAAKDAVRRLLKQRYEIEMLPADIEIGNDPEGRPFATVFGLSESAMTPSISIAHTDGRAVAIAGYCSEGQRVGIDLERIQSRERSFQEIAFSNDELALLDSCAGSARDEWVTRFWCAKEATAKALGKGLVEGPRSLSVRGLDARTGMVEVVLGDALSRGFPELAGVPLVVYTASEEDVVVASTLCERSEAGERQ
jgi:malonyl CoA-acyl carrier protein transacylase/phosphopantetheinyl transferase